MLKLTDYDYSWINDYLTKSGSQKVKKIGYDWKYVFDDKVVVVMELPAIGSSQKSYHGKAKVLTCMDNAGNSAFYLLSYDTVVAMVRNDKFYRLWGDWSATTAKHVNSFRLAFGLPKISKKEWLALSCYVYNARKQVFE